MPRISRDRQAALAREIAAAILRADSDAAATEVTRRLITNSDAAGLVDVLVQHPDPVVRAWIADRSVEIPKVDDARRALRTLARDRDSDVRDMAIGHLMRIGDQQDQQLVLRTLMTNLVSNDFGTNRFGLWQLVRLRARAALPAIAAFRADRRSPWKDLAGSVAIAVIEGRDAEVIDALRAHDHDRMQFLATAAAIIGSNDAVEALRQCSVAAPDEQCRHDCSVALRSIGGLDAIG